MAISTLLGHFVVTQSDFLNRCTFSERNRISKCKSHFLFDFSTILMLSFLDSNMVISRNYFVFIEKKNISLLKKNILSIKIIAKIFKYLLSETQIGIGII